MPRESASEKPLYPCKSDMKIVLVMLLAIAGLAAAPVLAGAQSPADSADPAATFAGTTPGQLNFYTRPTEATKLHNYLFDGFGPYPISVVAGAAAVSQLDDSPPEWKEGAAGFGRRFASDYGMQAVTASTRYALAEAFHEDTLYYRCQCKGVFRRLRHALISTVTSRRGEDGRVVFSFPALVAPYAGTMTAVYGWYPRRYDAMDGFRMGNYSLLGYAGANLSLEFLYTGPRSWISRMHLNNTHGAPVATSY
jgi:hypothetical protein